ncbi:MAG: hypothetical protein ACT4OE_02010 [Sphingosinicella sp.]
MFEREAERLRAMLVAHGPPSPLLDLGSSTRIFREKGQPHIERRLFAPLRAAGVDIVHFDRAPGDGVDVAGDVLDPVVTARLGTQGFRCILASNLFEHVRARDEVAAACEAIVVPGGLILASAPASYPFHADPIDTGFRPSPPELAALFGRCELVAAEEMPVRTYAEEIAARGASVPGEIGRTLAWTLAGIVRPRSAWSRLDRWRWFNRPYRVSIVLMRRCSD